MIWDLKYLSAQLQQSFDHLNKLSPKEGAWLNSYIVSEKKLDLSLIGPDQGQESLYMNQRHRRRKAHSFAAARRREFSEA